MIHDHTDTDILIIHATSWFHAAIFSDLIPTAYLEIHTHHSLKASNGLRTRIQSFSLLWGCSDCRGSCKIVPDCQVSCWSSNFVSYTVFSQKELGDPKPVTFPETRTPKMSITKGGCYSAWVNSLPHLLDGLSLRELDLLLHNFF